MRITVVGLGPAGMSLLTAQARTALESTPHRYFRTGRHPAAEELWADGISFASYDTIYDEAERRDEVYYRIAEALLAAAEQYGEVVYAVPGSPTVGEEVTARLVEASRVGQVEVVLVPGISFVEAAGAALGFDLMTDGVRVIDAETVATSVTGAAGPLLVGQVWRPELLADTKVTLLEHYPPDHWVALLRALGGPGQSVRWVPLSELDHDRSTDPLTAVWVPASSAPGPGTVARFVELVRRLRGPGGCPWDAEQTHHSLTRHLVEETYEVLEAIEHLPAEAPRGDIPAGAYDHLEEELGDLLFQVVFHSVLAAEAGAFTIDDVARRVHDKLVSRHPHVFGDVEADTADTVMANWEVLKAAEKGRESTMDDVPRSLPALLYAHKIGRRAASTGFEWPADDPAAIPDKLREEIGELERATTQAEREDELGDVLFVAVEWARHLKIDPEAALRGAVAKFMRRFRAVEQLAAERGIDMRTAGFPALEELWQQAKAST